MHKTSRYTALLVIGVSVLFSMLGLSDSQARKYATELIAVLGVSVQEESISTIPVSTATVIRVIDGDTFVLGSGEKVRLIGVDAPEKNECFAEEASARLSQLILQQTVRLESDVSNRDRYDRLLRYVYVATDQSSEDTLVSVNTQLVLDGVAVAKAYPPDTQIQDELESAEVSAREEKKGLWAVCVDTQ